MRSGLETTNWHSHGKFFVAPVHDTYGFNPDSNAGSLHRRSVLITGASRGIGLTTAVHFARAGCPMIALAVRSSLAEAEAAVRKAAAAAAAAAADPQMAPKILALSLDITSTDSVQVRDLLVHGIPEPDAEYAQRGLVTLALNAGGVKTERALAMPQSRYGLLQDIAELSADTVVWLCEEKRIWLGGRYMEDLEKRKDEIAKVDLLRFRMAF